ncbi:MAG: RnfABCDGE type electron transport complex subunit D, partial [Planctomycetota bacterium]
MDQQRREERTATTVTAPARRALEAPFLRAPENARTVFAVTLAAACAPLAAGLMLFGWRAGVVAGVSIASCAFIERLYYRVSRTPALLGRSHAYLTGALLALTLPAFVPWYVPVVASAFAIIIGKAIFGGVGHFVWQPALVGRLAVAVMFPSIMSPVDWPLLARSRLLVGDVCKVKTPEDYRAWSRQPPLRGADGFRLPPPQRALAKLTRTTAAEAGTWG